jgi:hypothetical protein
MRHGDSTIRGRLAGERHNCTDLLRRRGRWRSWSWRIGEAALDIGNLLGLQPAAVPALDHIPWQMECPRRLPYPFAVGRSQNEFGPRHKLLRSAAFAYEVFQGFLFRGGERNTGGS